MLSHPELKDEIKFDKFEFDFNAYLNKDTEPKKKHME